jgi:hypothetical protein
MASPPAPLLCALALLAAAAGCRAPDAPEAPEIRAAEAERVAPADAGPPASDHAGLPGMSGHVPGPMVTHRSTGHGYGCGGHCAFNWFGSAVVTLSFAEGAVATAVDEGERNEESLYPDRRETDTLRWRYAWKGTIAHAGGGARLLQLAREGGACTRHVHETEHGDGGDATREHDEPCPPAPASLSLRCERGPVQVQRTWDDPAKTPRDAWTCTPTPPDPFYQEPNWGSGFPWVFGTDMDLLTRWTGEPFPQLVLQPFERDGGM